MSYEITATIKKIGAPIQVKDTFVKRDLVLETAGDYPQLVLIQFVQDRCDLLDKYAAGQEVTVGFDLRGREWNDKVFTNLQGWKINAANTTAPAPSATAAPEPKAFSGDKSKDDLPF